MEFSEEEYLKNLRIHAEETNRFLSNNGQSKRECLVCSVFLKCLGIDFSKEEIELPSDDPPDVIFRSAHFEIMDIHDENRRIHKDWKDKAKLYKNANTIRDVKGPPISPKPITYSEIIDLIIERLAVKKLAHYPPEVRENLDILVYVNLENNFLDLKSTYSNLDELKRQGWRSVSMIMDYNHSHVFHATVSAPEFIRQFINQTRNECENPWEI
jgi:hypothetical protein